MCKTYMYKYMYYYPKYTSVLLGRVLEDDDVTLTLQ